MTRKTLFLPVLSLLFFSACKKDSSGLEPGSEDTTSVSLIQTAVTTPINNQVGGYYIALPSNYEQTIKHYPLLLYIPGAGQLGDGHYGLPLLLNDGPAKLIHENKFPSTFKVNGKTFSFIVFTPQFKQTPTAADVQSCLNFVRQKYRVDNHRIYLSGLSVGSIAACNLAAEIPLTIAALVPMAGVPLDYASTNKCQRIAAGHLPVWAFHSEDDRQISIDIAKGFIATISNQHPGIPPKLTIWPYGGHDAWTRAVDPNYKENGLNIYEWMLQYTRL